MVNFFTYLSELRVFDESVIILESIKEIIFPKTELPKKMYSFVHSRMYFYRTNPTKKKEGR